MFETLPQVIAYHGWQIEVLPHEVEFLFCCYHPALPDYCNDGQAYANYQTALKAACQFIDREIAIQALVDVVNDWWVSGKVSDAEYWNLTDFD